VIAKLAKAVVVAFIFLTRLPMPRLAHISPEDNGRSLCAFPLVGLVIGLLLFIAASVLTWVLPVMVVATLLLTLWVLLTGGLHLDGLADSADAWLGGYGDKARTLEIMKDPRCGSAAVMTVALCCWSNLPGSTRCWKPDNSPGWLCRRLSGEVELCC